jgi:MFS family permease
VAREFHVGREVALLGISLYVIGLGIGPLFSGPLSEVYGRNIVYHVSFILFFAFTFPVAFAPNIGNVAWNVYTYHRQILITSPYRDVLGISISHGILRCGISQRWWW